MSKEIKIAPVEQYIIDQVRKIRLELQITAESLSKEVSPSGSTGFIGNIESAVKAATYTDHNLNIIAKVFSEKAAQLNHESIKKDYTLYDFYPENFLDDQPRIKTSVIIPRKEGSTNALNGLIEDLIYFTEPKSQRQITDDTNAKENMDRKAESFSSPLNYAVKKKKLIKIELADGAVLYQKP